MTEQIPPDIFAGRSPRFARDDTGAESMQEMKDVIAKVISQHGTCSAGHKVEDEFMVGQTTPEGMCSWAFCALFPFATVLQSGCSFPWEADEGKTTVACPDPENPVVFELKKIQ